MTAPDGFRARTVGSRESRRQHAARGSHGGGGRASRRSPGRRIIAIADCHCDPRRNCGLGAVADRRAAARLGHLGRSRGSRWRSSPRMSSSRSSRFRAPLSRWRRACCSGPTSAFRSLWWPARSAPSIALLLVRAAGWQLSRLVSHPRVDAMDARLRRARLAGGDGDADDSRGAVLGAQLRGRRVGGAGAALHAGHDGRPVARHRRRCHPRRCADRQRQPAAVPRVAVHRRLGVAGPALRGPHAPAPTQAATADVTP